MTEEGDIITWQGVNKVHTGVVVKSENGEFICRMHNGCSFQLSDLRYSRTAKLIKRDE